MSEITVPVQSSELLADLPQPEEESPYQSAEQEASVLFVRILDQALRPRAGLSWEVRGEGLTQNGLTDEAGELMVDDCAPGSYSLSADGQSVIVHSLLTSDFVGDDRPYEILIPARAAAASGGNDHV